MALQLGLDDLLADLQHARRLGDLGRLALIAYCEARRWARQAGEAEIAEQAAAIFTDQPHGSRDEFLQQVDVLMFKLQQVRARLEDAPPTLPTQRSAVQHRPHAQGD